MNASPVSGQLRYSMTGADVAECVFGAMHATFSDDGTRPSQFTNWVTERIEKPDSDAVIAQAGGARLSPLTRAKRIHITVTAA